MADVNQEWFSRGATGVAVEIFRLVRIPEDKQVRINRHTAIFVMGDKLEKMADKMEVMADTVYGVGDVIFRRFLFAPGVVVRDSVFRTISDLMTINPK